MPLSALGLLVSAAVLHAGWNLLVKRAGEKQIFTWWALVVGLLALPLLAFSAPLPVRVWPYVVGSAVAEAAYFVALTLAYKLGDFSLVYPIARGTAPAFLAVWAAIFLSERPSPQGLVGLGLLLLGLMVVGGSSWWTSRNVAKVGGGAIAAALAVALCISIYTVIDGAAVNMKFVDPTPYTIVVLSLSAVLTAPAVIVRYGRRALVAEWQINWLRIVIVGVLMMVTFTLVLHAYALARVNYAGAIREVSVVFAALAGWWWLGESFGLLRVIGAGLIFSGILVIALGG